jgi:hypothetical protein
MIVAPVVVIAMMPMPTIVVKSESDSRRIVIAAALVPAIAIAVTNRAGVGANRSRYDRAKSDQRGNRARRQQTAKGLLGCTPWAGQCPIHDGTVLARKYNERAADLFPFRFAILPQRV